MRRAFCAVALATFTVLTVSACSEGAVQDSGHPPVSDTTSAPTTLLNDTPGSGELDLWTESYVTPSGVVVECIVWWDFESRPRDCDWVGAKRPPNGQGEELSGIDRPTLGDGASVEEK